MSKSEPGGAAASAALAAASSGKKAARRAARGEGGGGAVAFEGGGGTLEAGPFFSFPGVDDGATARRRSVFDECEAKKKEVFWRGERRKRRTTSERAKANAPPLFSLYQRNKLLFFPQRRLKDIRGFALRVFSHRGQARRARYPLTKERWEMRDARCCRMGDDAPTSKLTDGGLFGHVQPLPLLSRHRTD